MTSETTRTPVHRLSFSPQTWRVKLAGAIFAHWRSDLDRLAAVIEARRAGCAMLCVGLLFLVHAAVERSMPMALGACVSTLFMAMNSYILVLWASLLRKRGPLGPRHAGSSTASFGSRAEWARALFEPRMMFSTAALGTVLTVMWSALSFTFIATLAPNGAPLGRVAAAAVLTLVVARLVYRSTMTLARGSFREYLGPTPLQLWFRSSVLPPLSRRRPRMAWVVVGVVGMSVLPWVGAGTMTTWVAMAIMGVMTLGAALMLSSALQRATAWDRKTLLSA